MECKKCNYNEFEEKKVNMHIGLYCKKCGAWQKFVKQNNNNKNANEYKREYMEKQPPTQRQKWYIREVIKYKGLIKNKYHASEIIDEYLVNEYLNENY